MVDTNSPRVAALIYDWYVSLDRAEAVDAQTHQVIEEILQTAMSLEQFRQMANKLRNSATFESSRQQLIDKWGAVMAAGPDENTANHFLAELYESFDHSLLFSHSLEVGKTTTRIGQVNDGVTAVGGNMPCWTLHLVTRGRAVYESERLIEVGRGDILLFSPSASCQYRRHPDSKLWVHDWVLFQPHPHWSQWMDWNPVGAGVFQVSVENRESFALLAALSADILRLDSDSPRLGPDLQYTRLEELLIRASSCLSSGAAGAQDPRVLRACEFIRDHLAEPFAVSAVAQHCNVSASRMAHLFQQHMGVGLMHWRNDLRMQQARKLLVGTNDSITCIAEKIGYGDPAQFSKYFAKHVGLSPREFRRSASQSAGKT